MLRAEIDDEDFGVLILEELEPEHEINIQDKLKPNNIKTKDKESTMCSWPSEDWFLLSDF